MNQNKLEEMNSIRWFHQIELEPGVFTPGCCDHRVYVATKRFGLPEDLNGKTVVDIGGWDGLFSFEAEKRGASLVKIYDVLENQGGHWGGTAGFEFAAQYLNSKVIYEERSIYDTYTDNDAPNGFDIVLFYGVLYHLTDPIQALKNLCKLTKEFAFIETAYSNFNSDNCFDGKCFWEFKPGHENDDTNYWYPTISGLIGALKYVGFKTAEIIWQDEYRMTIKAVK